MSYKIRATNKTRSPVNYNCKFYPPPT